MECKRVEAEGQKRGLGVGLAADSKNTESVLDLRVDLDALNVQEVLYPMIKLDLEMANESVCSFVQDVLVDSIPELGRKAKKRRLPGILFETAVRRQCCHVRRCKTEITYIEAASALGTRSAPAPINARWWILLDIGCGKERLWRVDGDVQRVEVGRCCEDKGRPSPARPYILKDETKVTNTASLSNFPEPLAHSLPTV